MNQKIVIFMMIYKLNHSNLAAWGFKYWDMRRWGYLNSPVYKRALIHYYIPEALRRFRKLDVPEENRNTYTYLREQIDQQKV